MERIDAVARCDGDFVSPDWNALMARAQNYVQVPGVNVDQPFHFYTPAELLDLADEPFEWLAKGLLTEHTHGQIAGEWKTLKTYLQIALWLGVASGSRVLNHFDVPHARPVVAFVGEGGRVPFARRFKRMAEAMDVDLNELQGDGMFHLVFDVASVEDEPFQDALKRALDDHQPGLVGLDPLYAYHGVMTDPRSLYQEGRLLNNLSAKCASAGASLLIGNHFNRQTRREDLGRITMAGGAEWVDSWLLVSHRETPLVESGEFKLDLQVGSRQWGGANLEVDFCLGRFNAETGQHDGRITFEVRSGSQGRDERSAVRAAKDEQAILDVLRDEGALSKTALREKVGGKAETFGRAFERLHATGTFLQGVEEYSDGRGHARKRPVWSLRPVEEAS